MRRSINKILTTHVGSMPGRGEIAAAKGEPDIDDVRAIVAAQRDVGIDIVNEGEFTKGGDWLSDIDGRPSGFLPSQNSGAPLILQGKDREAFADFYKYAAERGTLFYVTQKTPPMRRNHWVCTGPIGYAGQTAMQRE